MSELWMITYMATMGILFALGGTGNWKLASKSWRRIGIPIVTGVFLSVSGVPVLANVLSCVVLTSVLHLGYGSKHTWLVKAMVAVSYSAASLVIGLTIWQAVIPGAFLVTFWASNYVFQKDVPWKIWEFLMGVLISFSYIGALNRPWIS